VTAIAQVEPMTTARALRGPFDYRLPEELRGGVVGVGSMLVVPFARRQVLGVVVGLTDTSEVSEGKLLAPLRALDEGPPALPAELVALAEWIAAEYCSTIARALTLVLPPGAARRLSGRKRGVRVRSEHLQVGAERPEPPVLTRAQAQAYAQLSDALDARRFERRLLQGVTGSGKTEIYLLAVAHALEQGRGAIVLVPEIALTPQIVSRFRERFGQTVAILHSQLRSGERFQEWRRLRTGEARVCVGPRSAVFAPIESLGLIVVDEEHETSYKHEGDPRYDARDVAVKRARLAGALALFGSATPRPESAQLPRLCLPARVDGGPLPQVSVLDMCGHRAGLHPETVQALTRLRETRGKAIVLLNRRGWSNFLSCHSCGHVWSCPQCDVTLVLHRGAGGPAAPARSSGTGGSARPSERGAGRPAGSFIACHHCGHREPAPERCEQCGSISVARHGAGTERLQHDLALALDAHDERFPVVRLDADTAGSEGIAPLLRRFQDAESGVLVGTQMVAKGHDFPGVTLGVVLDADATLRFPDFRSEERTFALIAQLAGRVGRGGDGRVLVQTIAPEARAIAYAARHDSDGFLAGELDRRRALRYPPFSHLIRIVCAAPESAPAQAAASAVAEDLRGSLIGGLGASVLGPAALFRLRGQERRMLMVKSPDPALRAVCPRPAVRAVGEAVARAAGDRAHRGVSFSVDVDPQ
jgi:primosomal protein N' (replication factor Y) (superfamily II helicase)